MPAATPATILPAVVSPLSSRQRYGIASMLSTSNLPHVERQILHTAAALGSDPAEFQAAIKFARRIDRMLVRRDGFLPRPVVRLCQ